MIRAVAVGIAALTLTATGAVVAQPGRPPVLEGVGVDERVGGRIPLDLTFTEAVGRRVQLRDLFGDGRPVLLVLAYVRCKLLCSLVLRGTTDAVRDLPLELGRDYRVITVSLDPSEDSATSAVRRRELLQQVGHPGEVERWTYLVGAERSIRTLADSLGFRYAWDPRTEQFAHPAVIFALTPDGTISRYLHGVQFAPAELAAALRSAAAGEVSVASIAEAVLSCFRFDPAARAHREAIERYLRIGAAVVSTLLLSTVLLLFLWERRRGRRS